MKRKPHGFLGWLVLLLLLWNALAAAFCAVGAWQQRALLPQIGLSEWLAGYLLAAGVLMALLNLSAFVCLYLGCKPAIPLTWAALIVTLAGYWLERQLLWAPDQRGGNVVFMAVFHALCLAALGGYTYLESKKRGEDGSRN